MLHETIDRHVAIPPEQLVTLMSALFFGQAFPNPDDPEPDGPWGPVVRQVFGPATWLRHALGFTEPNPFVQRGAGILDRVALNPQPLPPRFAATVALAEAAVIRAELIGDVSAAGGHESAGGRYLSALIDDRCGTPPRKFPWPIPGPRPDWAMADVGPIDHFAMAVALNAMLQAGVSEDVASSIKAGQRKLLDAAMA